MLLAGDIGGTKTDLAVFSAEGGLRKPLAQKRFPSADYGSLAVMAQEFLAEVGQEVDSACFAVAGPVVAGHARLTNLPWVVAEEDLGKELKLGPVKLLNDLEAIANAVPHLGPADLHALNPGKPAPGGAIAVIAPGTGLGEAFLTWDGKGYQAHPSEGGHTDFGPTDETQLGLLRYLWGRFGHVSYERVGSGIGIPNIYDYLKESGAAPESPGLAEQLAAAEDRTPLIIQGALDEGNPCPLCRSTLEVFVGVLGAEAGNLALKVLATGGVYLAGGIPPRIVKALEGERFLSAFKNKGRFAELLGQVPVFVVLEQVALLGAAAHGLRTGA
jgi:glucokinase